MSGAELGRESERRYRSAFAMVTTLFFVWGFLTSLNDILIPHLKVIFDLNYAEAMLVQFAFFSSYAAFGIPSGKIVEWIGYQRTMVIGLLTMALGAVLFIPAANMPSFPLFLAALIVLAAGITALQVAANPYVTVLGPPQTASSRLNLTQAFNSLGTTVGPPLAGWLILRSAEKTVENTASMTPTLLHAYRIQQAATVKSPYLMITLALVVLALAICCTSSLGWTRREIFAQARRAAANKVSGVVGMWFWGRSPSLCMWEPRYRSAVF